jgi:hypothetical protein
MNVKSRLNNSSHSWGDRNRPLCPTISDQAIGFCNYQTLVSINNISEGIGTEKWDKGACPYRPKERGRVKRKVVPWLGMLPIEYSAP